ncbi:hypothetical protein A8H31_25865 [Burkholderia thailandensis]|nr:hypothetical protein A8H31_25865 [Burkholderia thailandensis]PHH38113.1 hypothetical protein CRX59_16985 [Burkholderia thailandensis]PNE79575.1 hypothetical protein A8H34_15465 [Burkholderia thailandensis]PNE85515.1 hypothetical protein A8H30_15115 [Burkholderia thailandensis]
MPLRGAGNPALTGGGARRSGAPAPTRSARPAVDAASTPKSTMAMFARPRRAFRPPLARCAALRETRARRHAFSLDERPVGNYFSTSGRSRASRDITFR